MAMDPYEIRIALLRARTNMSEIARAERVTPAFVRQVVFGERKTERIRKAIARAIGKEVTEIWPDKE